MVDRAMEGARHRRPPLVGIAVLVKDGVSLDGIVVPSDPRRSAIVTGKVGREVRDVVRLLQERGFTVSGVGRRTLSLRASAASFERTFRTRLVERKAGQRDRFGRIDFEAPGFDWRRSLPEVAKVVELIEVQRLATRAATAPPSGKPPVLQPKPFDPADLPGLLRALSARGPAAGEPVCVAIVDTGFDQRHGFYSDNGYSLEIRLSRFATNKLSDRDGHGTAVAAAFLAVGSAARLFGIKLHNHSYPASSSLPLEGLQRALSMRPRPSVISISWVIDMRDDGGGPLSIEQSGLAATRAEITAWAADPDPKRRIVFVCAAGNGEIGFPAVMSEVVAVGGAFCDTTGNVREVAAFSSAFTSLSEPTRTVPDVCGVLGILPPRIETLMPVPKASGWDEDRSPADGTTKNDGWAGIGGTSIATPQVAAVCAAMLQARPSLTSQQVQACLRSTARVIPDAVGGKDPRGGEGMVDATAAIAAAMNLP